MRWEKTEYLSKNKALRFMIFTLIELLCTLSIIAVLTAILLPVLSRAKSSVRTLYCKNNQKQIGQGLMFYVGDHNGRMITPAVVSYYWTAIIADDYDLGRGKSKSFLKMSLWNCPAYKNYNGNSDINNEDTAYGLNYYSFANISVSHGEHVGYVPFIMIKRPSEHLMVTETFAANQTIKGIYRANPNVDIIGNGRVSDVHAGMANVLYSDGHVNFQKTIQLNSGTWSTFATKEPWNYYLR